jgi:predicted dehydrogenase
MVIGIIGVGLIGKQRLICLCNSPKVSKIYILETNLQTVKSIADSKFIDSQKIAFCSDLIDFQSKDIDKYILSGNHKVNYEYIKLFIPLGKKILIEKPMGRNLEEAKIISNLELFNKQICVGFNYRFMPGVEKILKEIEDGQLGDIISIKLTLGHGGSPSDKDSWKLDGDIAGGGALLDPGVHLIDFLVNSLNFLGDLNFSDINIWRGFWKTGIEESIFALGTIGNTQVFMESSIVLWKTEFSIQVVGTKGYSKINGRGRSDGPQIHTSGKRWAWLDGHESQIESEVHQTIMEKDISLEKETLSWISDDHLLCDSKQSLRIMQQVSILYKIMSSK